MSSVNKPVAATKVTNPNKFSSEYLQRFRFTAKTIFDVGVHQGTPELYNLIPGAKLILIDPVSETAGKVRARWPDLQFDFVDAALGSKEGQSTLNITKLMSMTGFQARTSLAANAIIEQREVVVTTLDKIVSTRSPPGPYGIKIDTEGFELEVLRGAEQAIKNTEFIIAEVSIQKRFVDGYRFSEVVSFLGERGFELIDIFNVSPTVSRFFDCMFLPFDHPAFGNGR